MCGDDAHIMSASVVNFRSHSRTNAHNDQRNSYRLYCVHSVKAQTYVLIEEIYFIPHAARHLFVRKRFSGFTNTEIKS